LYCAIEKVRNENIHGTDAIVEAHRDVGAETRAVIERIGGTMPEDLPTEPSIRPLLDQQARRRKKAIQQAGPTLFDTLPTPTHDATDKYIIHTMKPIPTAKTRPLAYSARGLVIHFDGLVKIEIFQRMRQIHRS